MQIFFFLKGKVSKVNALVVERRGGEPLSPQDYGFPCRCLPATLSALCPLRRGPCGEL